MPDLQVSPFQERVLLVPEQYDLALLGGRGSSKTYAALLLALRHVEEYGERARVLVVRRTYRSLADFELLCRDLFGRAYGTAASYNASEHVWRFANGAYMELGQLESEADYAKYQGRSFSLLIIDEAGQYADPGLIGRLRSNLRGPEGLPLRTVVVANPGDVGHVWLSRRYLRGEPWTPTADPETGRAFVRCPSTFRDNPFIDGEAYRAQVEASCAGDPELLRAWLEGDWTVARGAFFGSVISESRNLIEPWPLPQKPLPGSHRRELVNELELF